jgi:hypothetical protein
MRRSGIAALALCLSVAAATAFAADHPFSGFLTFTPPGESRYSPCAGFDAAGMAGYLSADRSTLPPAGRLKMTSPEMDDATVAIMTRVLETIIADKRE